jgi:Rps23 Pro-64 3,4-dihydroxylase Tpa1-like proline 4-hydroxylase
MAGARPVRVHLLLTGGHRQRLELDSDSPVLKELLDALVARLGPAPGRVVLFQIPLQGGRSALTFTSDQLVGLNTEPPVLASTEDVVVTPESLTMVRARYVCFHDVLGEPAKARLLGEAIARESKLVPSRVAGDVPDYRRSRLISQPGDLTAGVVGRVRELIPELCERLEVATFPVGRIEAQLTVHNDGDYYRAHTDNGTDETRTREISYVYYFHRQPKRFTGGELALYDSRLDDSRRLVPAGPPVAVIEPVDDSLVVFPSSCLHEVRPVRLASPELADGRFTINGWVRRAGDDPSG